MGTRAREVDLVLVPMIFSAGVSLLAAGPIFKTEPWPNIQSWTGWGLFVITFPAFFLLRARARKEDEAEGNRVVPEEQERDLYACLSASCDEAQSIAGAMWGYEQGREGVTPELVERAGKAVTEWGFGTKVLFLTMLNDRSLVSPFLHAVFPMSDEPWTWESLKVRLEDGVEVVRKTRDAMQLRQIRMHRKVGDWSQWTRRQGSLIF